MFGELRTLGVFNALLSDGRALYASCSTKLCYVERKAPFGAATLIDEDMEVDFAKETTPDDRVVVLASTPLTRNETWTHVPPQTTLVARKGTIVKTFSDKPLTSPHTPSTIRVQGASPLVVRPAGVEPA